MIALERINNILELIPPLKNLSEYPKAVQFRNIVEKVRDDYQDATPTLFITKMLDGE